MILRYGSKAVSKKLDDNTLDDVFDAILGGFVRQYDGAVSEKLI